MSNINSYIASKKENSPRFKKVSKKYFLKKAFLGGHSKGGNLAIYTAIVSTDALRKLKEKSLSMSFLKYGKNSEVHL